MNERIRELGKSVGLYMENAHPGGFPNEELQVVEDFANLIIEECIKVCNSRVGNSDYNTGRMHCVSDIKQHFGIKE